MAIKRILLLLFIVNTLIAIKGYAQLTLLPLTNTTKRTIVVMGSSSAAGWKATVPDSAWVNRLQADLNFYGRGDIIINIANPGNTTFDCLPTGAPFAANGYPSNPAQNVTKALSLNPTFVIISLPTNDIRNGYTNSETLANYTTITNALIAANVPFILTGTQPRDLATDVGCSTAFDFSSVCLSTGGLSVAQQNDLATFNTLLTAQYPATGTPYNTTVVNNFLSLLSVTPTNYEVNPAFGYGDGIHYVDAGHRIVYNTFINFQYYKDLVNFSQTITFSLSSKAIGTPDFSPGATADSGLPITYTSDNPAVATIVAGKIHLVGTGTAHITASQAGDVHHLAAPDNIQTLVCTPPPATLYDWTGAVSTVWNDPANWQVSGSPATDYPGDALSTDIVNIGVNVSFTNNPVIATSLPNEVASLNFGDNLITGSATTIDSLTINTGAALTVTGQLLQKHTTAGVLNSGNSAKVNVITTYIKGGGIINCGSVVVGDNTTPTADGVVNITKMELGSPAGGSTVTMNTSTLVLNTQSSDNAGATQILSTNDAQFSLAQGTLTIAGQIQLTDGGATDFTGTLFEPASLFSVDLYNTSDSPVLNLQYVNALTSQMGNVGNKVDFYNVVQTGGSGIATVNYTGITDQEVYNYVSSATVDNIIDNTGADAGDGVIYENLGFGGSGTKTVDAAIPTGTLIVGGNVTLATGTEIVDLSTNNCALIIYADFTTGSGATFNLGARPMLIGGSFTNAGTSNFGNALLTFNATDNFETLSTVNPQLFTNVAFAGGVSETITSGSFLLASTGVLTLRDSLGNHSQLVTGGHLTLISDANGSAIIAAIPPGCSITGNVNVQRYIANHRAYRLASSPVYSSTAGSNNIFSLNYITRAIYTTGTTGTGGGFDKGGNPTIYLYRENLAPQFTTFLNSNFRGVNNISDTLNYQMDLDGGPFNLPVGNGYMFYYRGSRRQDSLAGLTKAGAASTTDTLTATGLLNQGTVTVSDWYTPASSNLGWTTNSGNAAVEGTNLVGNPYASSIDWDQYSATDPSAGIYAPNVAPFSYQLIPSGAQGSGNYGIYTAGAGGSGGTNGATNIIASGVGFFVQADNASAQLIFNENAKTNTQAVVGSTLFMATHVTTGTNDQFLRLQFGMDSINTDENLIRFDKSAKSSFNYMEDARYRFGTGIVSLSSVSTDNVSLAINKTPLPKNNRVLPIPLKLAATSDGNYFLKMTALNQVPQLYDVWLMDAYTKDSVNMRSHPCYNFNIARADTNTMGSKRFMLLIRENPAYAYRLLSFTGHPTDHVTQVQLDWTTENEQNYTSFTVERSNDDGKTFIVAGGFMSSGVGTYSLLDKNPWIGENVYRLKQEDIDNNITYSNNVYINIIDKSNRVVCLYPNPTKNIINLTINAKTSDSDTFNITVSNSSGLIVRNVKSTQATWESNVSELLTGTYLIRVVNAKDNSLVGEAKFVKL